MKLISFEVHGTPRFGVVGAAGRYAIDCKKARIARGSACKPPANLCDLIAQGGEGLQQVREDLAWAASRDADDTAGIYLLSAVRLLAPTGLPPKLVCFSVYEGHMRNATRSVMKMRLGALGGVLAASGLIGIPKSFYRSPIYYKGNHNSVSGPEQDILWPGNSQMLDYEMELAVVIGQGGVNIDRRDAMSHVFGYTVFNDFSARDWLMKELLGMRGPLKSKDFASGNALGPWVVTSDEVADPHALAMQVRVNGLLRGQSNTAQMTHRIEALIAESSRHEPLPSGSVIGTGCATHGCGLEQGTFLRPGDQVEVEIEHIGVLRNRISNSQHC